MTNDQLREIKRQRQLRITIAMTHDELLMQLAIYDFWGSIGEIALGLTSECCFECDQGLMDIDAIMILTGKMNRLVWLCHECVSKAYETYRGRQFGNRSPMSWPFKT